jgi:hypothetical protein
LFFAQWRISDKLPNFLGRRPPGIRVSKGPANLSAVLVEVEIESHRATGIERV